MLERMAAGKVGNARLALGRGSDMFVDGKVGKELRDLEFAHLIWSRKRLGKRRPGGVTGHFDNSILLLEFSDLLALFPKDLLSADRRVTPAASEVVEDDLLSAAVDQFVITVTCCLELS